MLISPDSYNKVIPFTEYNPDEHVLEILRGYISSGVSGKKQYTLYKDTMRFAVNKYNYRQTGLQGNYDDFYEYTLEINKPDVNKPGINKSYIVSPNEEKLRGFCGYINRLTCL